MKLNPKDFDDGYFNPFWLKVRAAKLEAAVWVLENWTDERVQEIVNWEGDRTTDHYDYSDEDYCRRVSNLWKEIHPDLDLNSSTATHECYEFLSDFIICNAKHKKDAKRKRKELELEKARKKVEQLEADLNN